MTVPVRGMTMSGRLAVADSARLWTWYERGLFILCAVLVAWQLFVPPSLGVADNNDFPKLIGRYCLGEAQHPLFDYVSFAYRRAPSDCWNSGLITSATLPMEIALAISRVFLPPGHFDLRLLGGIYAALFLGAFYSLQLLARRLQPIPRVLLPSVALVIFGGAAYLPLFNSFYFDAASCAGLLLSAVAICGLVLNREVSLWEYGLITSVVLFFAMSKSQHAPLAILFLPAFWLSFGRRRFPSRAARVMATIAISAGVVVMIASVPRSYTVVALYNALFYQSLPRSPNAVRDLQELGIDSSMVRYVGKDAFRPDSPMQNPAAVEAFASRVSLPKTAFYFLAHPRVCIRVLSYALDEASLQRVRMEIGERQYRLGNYERFSGHTPESQSHFLSQWSDWKARLFGNRSALYAAYSGALLCGLWLLAGRRTAARRPQALVLVAMLTAAIGAALLIVLFDGVETGRHLFVFNALLDMAICAGVALL